MRGGEGKRGLKEEGGLLEGELMWERGGLIEDLQYGWPKQNGFFWPETGYRLWARNQVSLKFVLPGRKAWNWVCFYSDLTFERSGLSLRRKKQFAKFSQRSTPQEAGICPVHNTLSSCRCINFYTVKNSLTEHEKKCLLVVENKWRQ